MVIVAVVLIRLSKGGWYVWYGSCVRERVREGNDGWRMRGLFCVCSMCVWFVMAAEVCRSRRFASSTIVADLATKNTKPMTLECERKCTRGKQNCRNGPRAIGCQNEGFMQMQAERASTNKKTDGSVRRRKEFGRSIYFYKILCFINERKTKPIIKLIPSLQSYNMSYISKQNYQF
jgi:hypothetical protein